MHYLFASIALTAFWLLLSGHFTGLLLTLGGLSVLLVVWLVRRMDLVDHEPSLLKPSYRVPGYLLWLLWCVVKSNIDLARRIWDPNLPIHPTWTRLDTNVTTPMEKALYANSITLTPGTLTTDVREDHFLVHSLSKESLAELRQGEMERRIKQLGI